jgi:hypothetical protein
VSGQLFQFANSVAYCGAGVVMFIIATIDLWFFTPYRMPDFPIPFGILQWGAIFGLFASTIVFARAVRLSRSSAQKVQNNG